MWPSYNRPHHGSCSSVRLSVCPSVHRIVYKLLTRKQKVVEQPNLLSTFPFRDVGNRCPDFELKRSTIRISLFYCKRVLMFSYDVSGVVGKKVGGQGSCNFPTDSCKFPLDVITSAQKFSIPHQILQKWVISRSKFCIFRRKFSDMPKCTDGAGEAIAADPGTTPL